MKKKMTIEEVYKEIDRRIRETPTAKLLKDIRDASAYAHRKASQFFWEYFCKTTIDSGKY